MATTIRSLVVLTLCLGVACDSSRSLNPTPVLTGQWQGTITDSRRGTGVLHLTITQTTPGLAGNWMAAFASGPASAGVVSGTVNGSTVSLFLTPDVLIVCPQSSTLSGTLAVTAKVSGTRLVGTYVVLLCEGAANGDVDLARE